MSALDASAIAWLLAERVEPLAMEPIGSPPTFRSRTECRFYPKGGLVVTTAGPKRGIWCHHGEGGIGGDALLMVQHFRRCSTREALAWSAAWLGLAGDVHYGAPPRPRPSAPAAEPDGKDTIELARRIWRESLPGAGTPVDRYLRGRGLRLPDDAPIHFHPACRRGSELLPAMICLMTNAESGAPCGVHRTFLLASGAGKAPGNAKMMLGRAGVIRLVHDDQVLLGLGLAEGIETGLAVMQVVRWSPVWAAASAGAIRKFSVLPGIEHINLFADRDDAGAGITAARTCAARWREAGREATIFLPPFGTDWHDASRAIAT